MRNCKNQSACPVSCRYCVITEVTDRREMWKNQRIVGINKAVTIVNPPRDSRRCQDFFDFPYSLLLGDIVGFNAISDPFWSRYDVYLRYFLTHVAPIAKLVTCVTKMKPSPRVWDLLAEIPNFALVVSITGLDALERTKTAQRLEILRIARERDIAAFPIIHPYIAGMSDLGFLPQLRDMGYDLIDVKGLRYDRGMDDWMYPATIAGYRGTEGQEVLPEDGWRDKITASGIEIISLQRWYSRLCENKGPNLQPEVAAQMVDRVLQYANITSSDSDDAVVHAAIQRRC
jgi:hypothetical protein